MINSNLATILEVGGLTVGEITYSVLKEYSILFQSFWDTKKKKQKRAAAEADERQKRWTINGYT
jgi:hypothetical protein